MGAPVAGVIRVSAPARLHLGMIDLTGENGRRFGGIGVALQSPRVVVTVSPAPDLHVIGPGQKRVLAVAEQLRAAGVPVNGMVRVEEVIPEHIGLGSGTQLSLAVGAALTRLAGRDIPASGLAALTGRGARSGIGTRAFETGGFLLEGGRREQAGALAPLIGRYDFPCEWRWVIAVPAVGEGLHGERERRAFDRFRVGEQVMPRAAVGRIAELVLMQLVPSLLDGDFIGFGEALTEIQQLNGVAYAATQGDIYAHPAGALLVDRWRAMGGSGTGQSSWGPAMYALAPGIAAAERMAEVAQVTLAEAGLQGDVWVTRADNKGGVVQPVAAPVFDTLEPRKPIKESGLHE